jgi:hypothetical protein
MKASDGSDDEPTAEELAEAEALARALDPGAAAAASPGGRPAPEDALATAALLRHARQAGAAPVPAGARVTAARALERRRPPGWRWVVSVFVLPAAAAATITLFVTFGLRSYRQSGRAALPAPAITLLEAQARAARGKADLAALDRQMRAYRTALYGALATREGDSR